MEKFVPQENIFIKAEKLDIWHKRFVYATAFISFITGILSSTRFCFQFPQKLVDTWLPGIVFVFTVITGVLRFLFTYQYRQAEAVRRDDFFDNAFGSLLGDRQSIGYFSNENISVGLKKALIDVNENCFYSSDIIQHMFCCRTTIALISSVFLIFVIVLNICDHSFTLLALNSFLTLDIVTDVVSLYRLKQDLEKIHNNCKFILSSHALDEECNNQLQVVGYVIRDIVRYETALSYASTMFDYKYFKKIHPKKAAEWEEYKKRYLQ